MKNISILKKVIMYDLEALKDSMLCDSQTASIDFNYHFNLLKGNLRDLFKLVKIVKKINRGIK
jgi:hypothetical protein